jgi:tol-pal system protein YbgF
MKRIVLTVLLLSLSAAASAQKAPTLEQRLERLERILQNQSLSDIVLQLQRMQREVQQLRGELEVQRHELNALEGRQRELYLDLDRRLGQPASMAPEAPPTTLPTTQPAGPVDAPPVAAPAAPSAPPQTTAPGDPAREEAAYQRAFKLLQQGDYPAALTAFRAFVADYPGGSLTDNAQYWLGETSYVTRDFDTAMKEFALVLERFPNSAKVPGSLLKMGYIHYEKRQWREAKDILGKIVREYPSTTEAKLAQSRLDRIRTEGR